MQGEFSAASSSRQRFGIVLQVGVGDTLEFVDPELVEFGLLDRDSLRLRCTLASTSSHFLALKASWAAPMSFEIFLVTLRSPQASVCAIAAEAIPRHATKAQAVPRVQPIRHFQRSLQTSRGLCRPRLGFAIPPCRTSSKIGYAAPAESFPEAFEDWLSGRVSRETPRCSRSPSSSCDCAAPLP